MIASLTPPIRSSGELGSPDGVGRIFTLHHRLPSAVTLCFKSHLESIIPGARMSDQDLKAELERLKAENAALKQRGRSGAAFLKVSEKGAVSVYGLGRFPVTLYKEQWGKLLSMAEDIKTFITEHDSELKKKE
jgi:hypothetical protein